MSYHGETLATVDKGPDGAPGAERQLPAQPPSFEEATQPRADDKTNPWTQECIEIKRDDEKVIKTICHNEEHPALRRKASESTPSVADTNPEADADLQKGSKQEEDDASGQKKSRSSLRKGAAAIKRANPIVEKTLLGFQKASLALVAVGVLLPCF